MVTLATDAFPGMHPVAGLVGYGVLAATTVWYAVALRDWRRAVGAVGAMLLGVALTAFYCLPVALEWSLARGSMMAVAAYHGQRGVAARVPSNAAPTAISRK